MQLADEHVKTARKAFQPCVEAFEQDFVDPNKIVDLSDCSDSVIIKAHVFIAGYENLLCDD